MRRLLAMLTVAAFALVACGGDEGSEDGGETGGEGSSLEACGDAPAGVDVAGTEGLPADFPFPDEVTVTSAEVAGPSLVVEGYYDGGLEDAYEGWNSAFEDGGYEVEGGETEPEFHEGEVEFKGGQTEGQVKLEQECEERTNVRITIRPAA